KREGGGEVAFMARATPAGATAFAPPRPPGWVVLSNWLGRMVGEGVSCSPSTPSTLPTLSTLHPSVACDEEDDLPAAVALLEAGAEAERAPEVLARHVPLPPVRQPHAVPQPRPGVLAVPPLHDGHDGVGQARPGPGRGRTRRADGHVLAPYGPRRVRVAVGGRALLGVGRRDHARRPGHGPHAHDAGEGLPGREAVVGGAAEPDGADALGAG